MIPGEIIPASGPDSDIELNVGQKTIKVKENSKKY